MSKLADFYRLKNARFNSRLALAQAGCEGKSDAKLLLYKLEGPQR